MRKRHVMILRRNKKRSGKMHSKRLPENHAKKSTSRAQARRIVLYLSMLLLAAVSILHYFDYFPMGNRGIHQSMFARTVKTLVSSRVFPEQHEAAEAAQKALAQRIQLLLGGNLEEIMDNYDLSGTSGTWAYENETNRIAYFRKWALARNVRLVDVESTFEVDSVSKEDGGSYWIELTEHTFYAYEYIDNSFEFTWILGMGTSTGLCGNLTASFGIGRGTGCGSGVNMLTGPTSRGSSVRHEFGSRTVHVIEMVRVDDKWKIRKDWYMDPLGNNAGESGEVALTLSGKYAVGTWNFPALGDDSVACTSAISVLDMTPMSAAQNAIYDETALGLSKGFFKLYEAQSAKPLFNRDKAFEYAVKYSGVRALPDGGRYNSKYKVYTFAGGDCANFASQVLHAGGIPHGHGWHYTKEGSTAWVQSESLVWHLLSSGRGYRLFRGKFGDAVSSNQGSDRAAMVAPLTGAFAASSSFSNQSSDSAGMVVPDTDFAHEFTGESAGESAGESVVDNAAVDDGKSSSECLADQLEPGDIIAYEIRGQIYHVAVVVGKDPRGYVTIASHTSDRLYFPWDLGWDQSTVFWFIKISY